MKEWIPASAVVDMNARTVKIQVEEIEITFTSINVSLNAHQLLKEINQELVRVNAGVYVYRIEPVEEVAPVHHLFPDGRIPVLTNAHTRADVTGYAVLQDRPYQHTLVYVGIAAHKTSVESLWASLIRGKGSCSMRGTSVLADGEVKMLTQPLPEFNVLHAGIICRKALPGKWEAKDDAAYALVFETGMRRGSGVADACLEPLAGDAGVSHPGYMGKDPMGVCIGYLNTSNAWKPVGIVVAVYA